MPFKVRENRQRGNYSLRKKDNPLGGFVGVGCGREMEASQIETTSVTIMGSATQELLRRNRHRFQAIRFAVVSTKSPFPL